MRLTMNYMVISACTRPCDATIFTSSVRRIHLLQQKILIWMKAFWYRKVFHLDIKEISTQSHIYKLFLIKLFADISDSSFFLDSLSKAEIFPKFSSGNSFLFFKRFWNVRFCDRSHFILTLFLHEKANTVIFNFSALER